MKHLFPYIGDIDDREDFSQRIFRYMKKKISLKRYRIVRRKGRAREKATGTRAEREKTALLNGIGIPNIIECERPANGKYI